MHYYKFHLKDYKADTGHLDYLEDLVYRRMIDLAFLTELPLPNETKSIARAIGMRDQCERIDAILEEFWELEDHGWVNGGVKKALGKVYAKSTIAKKAADARWDKANAKKMRNHAKNHANASKNDADAYKNDADASKNDANAMRTACVTDAKPMLTACLTDATHYPLPITHYPESDEASSSCPEAQATPDNFVEMTIPTISYETKGELFSITREMLDEWQDTYPLMDVRQEVKRAVQWARDNPGKRKTLKGMRRYLGAWLSKTHDKGYHNGPGQKPSNQGGKLSGSERTRRARDQQRRAEQAGSDIL